MKTLAVIPARLGATRLPRKPLRLLAGLPLIVRVWERVSRHRRRRPLRRRDRQRRDRCRSSRRTAARPSSRDERTHRAPTASPKSRVAPISRLRRDPQRAGRRAIRSRPTRCAARWSRSPADISRSARPPSARRPTSSRPRRRESRRRRRRPRDVFFARTDSVSARRATDAARCERARSAAHRRLRVHAATR